MQPIDFVMIWVDSTDTKWQQQYIYYKSKETKTKIDELVDQCRYRDWNNLHYWFRSVEKFCPWVRKIHLVTCGHFPEFLVKNHPKLNLVTHDQIIEPHCLPTFNSHAIEINIHKIEGLAEHFVYFNDDTFINSPLEPEFFFKNGLPCDGIQLQPLMVVGEENFLGAVALTDVAIINKYFDKRKLFRSNPSALFNHRYSISNNLGNFLSLYNRKFSSFYSTHLPQPFLKSVFEEVWRNEESYLKEVSSHRFRQPLDVNQYLFRLWQLCSARFYPVNIFQRGLNFNLRIQNLPEINHVIKNEQLPQICLNDDEHVVDFEKLKTEIIQIFEQKFNTVSSFEKKITH
ncbi:glycosyl transferase [Acinetobacter baumannii]|uniref:stealth conserved region 3 domain-containing protein n=1 Tax=Acinetobacter baumannii TaxID=470 RepID=UPI00057D3520|nr:stealth conserved region 3 domain-containing protein [Acinetobacter baumannii]KHT82660.1 glycosyl transferase [Acinetobacter baumannii]OTK89286.1 glycosyl transferase [Acinetobacter baumannii]